MKNSKANDENKVLKYWFWWPIKTLDTFEADTPPVMQVAKNIYAPLVSDFINGKVEGMLAKNWEIDASGRIWKFNIRENLVFENGDPITPEIILKNYQRILFLTRNEGLYLNSLLDDLKKMKGISSKLSNVFINKEKQLVFKFNKAPLGLFETISQPMYGIVHPSCFDKNGKWKDSNCSIASGQYQILERTSHKIVLKSRDVFRAVPNAPLMVEIHAPMPNKTVVDALMEKTGNLTVEHSFALSSEKIEILKNSKIKILEEPPVRMHFVHLNHLHTAFKNKKLRQSIRENFLFALNQNSDYQKNNHKVNASFIPEGGIGYDRFLIPSQKPRIVKSSTKRKIDILLFPLSSDPLVQNSIQDVLIKVLEEHNFELNIKKYPDRFEPFNLMKKNKFDVIVRGTGILINNPYADLRLMFLSKMGANIPDPSKKISKIILKAEKELSEQKREGIVKKINKSIYDESAIITFTHSRLLYLYSDTVDLKDINLYSDPIEFRAVSL